MDYQRMLEKIGGKELLPIQQKMIEAVKNQSLIGLYAPTGSGKTLAYIFGLLQSFELNPWKNALIIAPTRELAIQIHSVLGQLSTGFSSTLCYGGHQFSVERNNLKNNPQIIIGTPGRIADHIRRDTFDFKRIEAIIIDEEDKIHELGFDREISEITSAIGEVKLAIHVSATGNNTSKTTKNSSSLFIIDERKKANLPSLHYFQVEVKDEEHKALALFNLLQSLEPKKTLVFFNHREAITRIESYLFQNGFVSTVFHGGLEQDERERNLIKFSNGTVDLLLVSDLASRGIDVPEIKNIIHYQFPKDEAAFIHRNGRAARMGEEGSVFCILDQREIESIEYLRDKDINTFQFKQKKYHWNTQKTTLFLSLGKKDKVNKIDVLGFFSKELEIKASDIGKIDTMDFSTFVCVNQSVADKIIKLGNGNKLKKQTVKIRLSK
ncbi:MAG: DEAD/DEAH box helicase [Crocinitomicaceae bacterium]